MPHTNEDTEKEIENEEAQTEDLQPNLQTGIHHGTEGRPFYSLLNGDRPDRGPLYFAQSK